MTTTVTLTAAQPLTLELNEFVISDVSFDLSNEVWGVKATGGLTRPTNVHQDDLDIHWVIHSSFDIKVNYDEIAAHTGSDPATVRDTLTVSQLNTAVNEIALGKALAAI